jgi:putative component of membrane protein insertase Oxa1/YidC/SpoIIIJ protein YidD
LLFFSGCTSVPSLELASGIDAHFEFDKIKESLAGTAAASPGVEVYRSSFGRILGSHCQYFPSDSTYHLERSRRCGALNSTAQSMARFFLEPDAATMGLPIIVDNESVSYKDLPNDCHWL